MDFNRLTLGLPGLIGDLLSSTSERLFEPVVRLGVTGLALLFGIQAAINMMVNLHMMPAKGMTLPFISYGGSSLIALSIGMGLLLAFTRRNPHLHRSPYVGQEWRGR